MSQTDSARSVGTDPSHHLLIVDDEPHICNALRRLFRPDGYQITATSNVSEALQLIDEKFVDVVISDQRMPECNGTDFLRKVQEKRPQTVRMILSGFSDVQDITEAMDTGAIYKFLTKPWDDALLRANVREAFGRASALRALDSQAKPKTFAGLPSLEHLHEVFATIHAEANAQGAALCVVMVYLDQLSQFSAGFGHAATLELRRAVNDYVVRVLGHESTVVNGADQSLVVLTKSSDPQERFQEVAERLASISREPLVVAGQIVRLTLSVGCALVNDRSSELEPALEEAKAAAMSVRGAGGNGFRVFDQDLQQQSRRELALETDLRDAAQAHLFDVYYQPQMDLTTGKLIGMEALIRWVHPVLGSVSPAEFIPIAERLGLIKEIGSFVLDRALADAPRWIDRGLSPGSLSVNVSPLQLLDPQFPKQVRELLYAHGLDGDRLMLEITETAAVELDSDLAAIFRELAEMGVALAIDDFGTGYSNLSHIADLPIAKLKIDRSLLPGRAKGDKAMSLFSNIVAMANAMNMTTIAEGVETPEELALVHDAGCDHIQGYFFSPPLHTDEMLRILEMGRMTAPSSRREQ